MNRKERWIYRMQQDLLDIASQSVKYINVIDDTNYYDLMSSLERRIKNLKSPRR